MSLPVVCEYRLEENNFIAGWKIFPKIKRPDLEGMPLPLAAMNQSLKDEYGNFRYRLVENDPGMFTIEDNMQAPTEHQIAVDTFSKTQIYKGFKALMSEISDLRSIAGGTSTTQYNKLKNVIDKIRNGF